MPDMESAINLSENYKTKAMQDFYSRPVQRPQAQAQPNNPSTIKTTTSPLEGTLDISKRRPD
jgi:hypothetical protein